MPSETTIAVDSGLSVKLHATTLQLKAAHDLLRVAMDCELELRAELAAYAPRIKELEERIESVFQALGLAPCESFDLADEIRRIRDEGREYFHAHATLTERCETAESKLQALATICGTNDANRFQTRVDRLVAEKAALTSDKERLDWIERNPGTFYPDSMLSGWRISFGPLRKSFHDPTLREAVDKARGEVV